ncbi:MAG: peroxiredoxin family protein [Bacteroidota bacterium]
MLNFLKSSIGTLYSMGAFVILILMMIVGIRSGFGFPIITTIFSALVVMLFFTVMMKRPKLVTNRHLPTYAIPILLSFVLSLINSAPEFGEHWLPISLNASLVVGWFLYNYAYSLYPVRSQLLKVGDHIPLMTFENTHGNVVHSEMFLGSPSVFLFYRGNWCPLCMLQIEEIAAKYKDIESLGAKVILISPQPHHYSKELAEKFNLGFHFLVDVENKVAKQLGIFHHNGLPLGLQTQGYKNDTVMPTLLITDETGRILFADLTDNYRIRPEPSTILQVLKGNEVVA